MSKRRFEIYQYRQAVLRMRQGDSDHEIARAGLMRMGRPKSKAVRRVAIERGWLDPTPPPPDYDVLAVVFANKPPTPTG